LQPHTHTTRRHVTAAEEEEERPPHHGYHHLNVLQGRRQPSKKEEEEVPTMKKCILHFESFFNVIVFKLFLFSLMNATALKRVT
jgi:hypothetical protein